MHIRRSPSGDGPTIYRPNESVAVRLDPPPRPVAHEPDSIPPPPRDSLLDAGQPTARPDPDRHGLDRRHRELRLGRMVGPQPGREGGRPRPGAARRPGADDPIAGQAGECRRPRAAQPGQGSLQPHRSGRRADRSRRSCCRHRRRPSCRRAACRRPPRPSEADTAKTPTPLQPAAPTTGGPTPPACRRRRDQFAGGRRRRPRPRRPRRRAAPASPA